MLEGRAVPTYVVSYDLRPDLDDGPLHDALRTYPRWAMVGHSTWVVSTGNLDNAATVRNHLMAVAPEARLLVVRSGVEAAWLNAMCASEWLRANL